MKMPWRIMTPADWLVVAALLVTALAGLAWLAGAPAGARVVAVCGGETCFSAPSGERRRVDLAGPLGVTRLLVDEQGARIIASPCRHKICVSMGPARRTGDLLACVPNRILVRIEGTASLTDGTSREVGYDLLSR
jgi:hypothetical protein